MRTNPRMHDLNSPVEPSGSKSPLLARTPLWLASSLAAALLAAHSAAQAGLELKMQTKTNPVQPNEAAQIGLVVSNSSGFTRSGVVLKLSYPAGLKSMYHALSEGGYCDGSVSGGYSCEPGEKLIWNLGSLPSGQSVSVSLPPEVAAATLPGTVIAFNAEVSDDRAEKASASESLTVSNGRNLQLHLGEYTPAPLQAGSALSYRLRFGHTGSSSVAPGSQLILDLPEGASFVAASDGGLLQTRQVVWNLGDLLPGQVGERQVDLRLDSGLQNGTVQKAKAQLTSSDGQTVRTQTVTPVEASNGIRLALDLNPSPAKAGTVVNSKLVVSNAGYFDRSNVTVRLRFPTGLAPLDHSLIDQGACDGSVSGGYNCDAQEILEWKLGTIPAGTSRSIQFTPRIDSVALPGSVIGLDAIARDSQNNKAISKEVIQVVANQTLQLNLTEVDQSPVALGSKQRYQLSYGNTASSGSVANSVLQVRLPNGSRLVSASEGGTVQANGLLQWTLGALGPGQVGERRFELETDPYLAPGSLLRPEAALRADGGRLIRSEVVSRVEGPSELKLAIDVNANPAIPGESVDTKLTVSNTSSFDRSNVWVSLRFPEGLNSTDHGLTLGGSCDGSVSGGYSCDPLERLKWHFPLVPAGQSRTVSLPPYVSSSTSPGRLSEFFATAGDEAGNFVSATDSLQVVNGRTLQLALTEQGQEPVLPGSSIGYQLNFGNSHSSNAANGAVLELRLPQGFIAQAISDGGSVVDGSVRWNLGALAPGQVGQRTLSLLAPSLGDQEAGSVYKLEALLRDGAGKRIRANDTSRVETEQPWGIALNLGSNPRDPGQTVPVAIKVSNNTDFDRFNVRLSTRYPLGLNALDHGATNGGACDGSVSGGYSCDGLEILSWNLGTVPARSSVTKTFTPTIKPTLSKGNLIEFTSWVEDAGHNARATSILRVGKEAAPFVDPDGDGIPDDQDNCKLVANPDQRDSDGDGYGNMCDGDLDNNGIVNAIDLGKFKTFMGKTGPNLAADLDGNGIVNAIDLAIFKRLFGKPPGPSGKVPKAASQQP